MTGEGDRPDPAGNRAGERDRPRRKPLASRPRPQRPALPGTDPEKQLAIVALGYASCWIEGHVTDADDQGKRIAALLGLPEEEELVCVLPVGKPAEAPRPVRKKPFDTRASFR